MSEERNAYMRRYYSNYTPEELDKRKAAQKNWRENNKEHLWSKRLLSSYGITGEDWKRMYADQEGSCAICKTAIQKPLGRGNEQYDAHVDHCHTSGKVRALLCSKCNRGLGLFLDSAESLRAAADYVERFR